MKKIIFILGLITIIESMVILGLVYHYRIYDRIILMIRNERLPVMYQEYEQNIYYKPYSELFESYRKKTGGNGIIFIGDSQVSMPDWQKLLEEKGEIFNFGIPGDTTRGVYSRLDEVAGDEPEKIIIWIGINDFLRGRTSDEVIQSFREYADKLSQYKGEIYILSVLPVSEAWVNSLKINAEVIRYNQLLKEESQLHGWHYINLIPETTVNGELDSELTYDGLHLNAKGYGIVARLIQDALRDTERK